MTLFEPVQFDPVYAPGGYIRLCVQFNAVPRRSVHQLTNGGAVASHLGYIQRKILILKWHPLNLELTNNFIFDQEKDGWILDGEPQTTPAVNDTLNLYNTEIKFVRYTATYDGINTVGGQVRSTSQV